MDLREKGVQIRVPATANLMIDSLDRPVQDNNPIYASQFQITKPAALLNGQFNRIATAEVVLEWFTPNISTTYDNNDLVIDLSGSTSGTYNQTYFATSGFYTQAQLIKWVNLVLNNAGQNVVPAVTWTVAPLGYGAGAVLTPSAAVYVGWGNGSTLAAALQLPYSNAPAPVLYIQYDPNTPLILRQAADLRRPAPFALAANPQLPPDTLRYIDFVSDNLTYNQDLQDNSTDKTSRNVLCRWYFAWDNPGLLDEYGFPILQGYTPFVERRIFNPPKQIKWDPIQPLGNLDFRVFASDGELLKANYQTNWLMTLQVSEN